MNRNERGIARSDMIHISMCVDSGVREAKSQKLSCAVCACGNPRSGSCFAACTTSGNLIASWMKNTGMLLPTRSQLPSLLYSFTANPRTSRARSAEPLFPATVENRTNAGVRSPARWNRSARVRSVSGSYVSNHPFAPYPRACTTRSGIRSWSKWKIFSRRWKSSSRAGPRGPTRSVFWSSATGTPCWVVNAGRPSPAT